MLSRVSIIEESEPKRVRMAYLAIIGSHKVNGVAELHSDLIKTTIFKDFVKVFGPDKFTNVTNGITPRRWLHQANPRLSELIASKLGSHQFLKDLTLLSGIEKYVDDAAFRKEFRDIKYANKVRLAKFLKEAQGVSVNPAALFDIQVKRIHEYKRQQLNIFGVIHRYLRLKKMSPEERKQVQPRVHMFGGKAAPGYWMAKTVIHLVNKVADVVNSDSDIGDLLKVVYIEDYNVSKCEIIAPASDISEHISTAGTEASGTSNMKFALNGGLIIGTCDGANIEVSSLRYPLRAVSANTFGYRSPEKLVKRTFSSSVTFLRTSKTFVITTATVNSSSMTISVRSLIPSRATASEMPTSSRLLSTVLSTMATSISSRMTSKAIAIPKILSTRRTRTRTIGSPSVFSVRQGLVSSLLIVVWLSMLTRCGLLVG